MRIKPVIWFHIGTMDKDKIRTMKILCESNEVVWYLNDYPDRPYEFWFKADYPFFNRILFYTGIHTNY